MALTVEEIRDRAANELGILPLGQPLADQDDTNITQAYNEVYAYLKKRGLATWGSTADVPDDVSPYVVAMVAWSRVNGYGVSNDRYKRLQLAFVAAEPAIRKLVLPSYVSQEEPTDF